MQGDNFGLKMRKVGRMWQDAKSGAPETPMYEDAQYIVTPSPGVNRSRTALSNRQVEDAQYIVTPSPGARHRQFSQRNTGFLRPETAIEAANLIGTSLPPALVGAMLQSPSLTAVLKNNPALVKVVTEKPELATLIAESPETVELMASNPEMVEKILNNTLNLNAERAAPTPAEENQMLTGLLAALGKTDTKAADSTAIDAMIEAKLGGGGGSNVPRQGSISFKFQ